MMLQLKPGDMLIKLRAAPQFLHVCVYPCVCVCVLCGPKFRPWAEAAAAAERRTQAVLPVHEINS